MGPGATQFTCTSGASALAAPVSAVTPAFDTPYRKISRYRRDAPPSPMFTILPIPRARISATEDVARAGRAPADSTPEGLVPLALAEAEAASGMNTDRH